MSAFLVPSDEGNIFSIINVRPLLLQHFMAKQLHMKKEPAVNRLFLQRVKKITVIKFIRRQKEP